MGQLPRVHQTFLHVRVREPDDHVVAVVEVVGDIAFAAEDFGDLVHLAAAADDAAPHVVALGEVIEGIVCGTRVDDLVASHSGTHQLLDHLAGHVQFAETLLDRHVLGRFHRVFCSGRKPTNDDVEHFFGNRGKLVGDDHVGAEPSDLGSIAQRQRVDDRFTDAEEAQIDTLLGT